MSVMRPELIMKSIIPVVMAGIIAIYGLVVAVLISGSLEKAPGYDLYTYVSALYDSAALNSHFDLCINVNGTWSSLQYSITAKKL